MNAETMNDLERFDNIKKRLKEVGTIKGDDLRFVLIRAEHSFMNVRVKVQPLLLRNAESVERQPVSKTRVKRLREIKRKYQSHPELDWLIEELESEWGL